VVGADPIRWAGGSDDGWGDGFISESDPNRHIYRRRLPSDGTRSDRTAEGAVPVGLVGDSDPYPPNLRGPSLTRGPCVREGRWCASRTRTRRELAWQHEQGCFLDGLMTHYRVLLILLAVFVVLTGTEPSMASCVHNKKLSIVRTLYTFFL
jgi:hypothetical protein